MGTVADQFSVAMIVPAKKKLKDLHKLVLNSRYALDRTSRQVTIGWLGELMYMLSCRRMIMLNELDRELGQLHIPTKPGPDVDGHFCGYAGSIPGPLEYMEACEAEEVYLTRVLESLNNDPELLEPTRATIASLLQGTRANLKDILYPRKNHGALQA